jgi:hypothetical protein
MQHLDERRIWEELLDEIPLTAEEREHLSLCTECQERHAMLALIRDELSVAQASRLTSEAEARLFSLLSQIGEEIPRADAFQLCVGKMAGWVNALPLWDSRQQAGAVGVRNSNQRSYRMLFGTNETEIELLVEPQGRHLRIVGEVMVADADGNNGLALIELATRVDAKSAIETESDARGRFSMEQIPPGRYVMTITPRFSQMLVIDPLELT